MNTSGVLLGAAMLALVGMAHSQPVTITLVEHGTVHAYHPQTKFQINPDLGRAWVHVSFKLDDLWQEAPMRSQRVAVEGLRFDAERSAVVLSLPDREVTCATVSDRRFPRLAGHRIEPTGMCKLETVTTREPFDNGFFVSNQDVTRTFLHVQS